MTITVNWDVKHQNKQNACVISELCYKGTLLQRHCRKMTMSFSNNSFVKLHVNFFCSHNMTCVISEYVL